MSRGMSTFHRCPALGLLLYSGIFLMSSFSNCSAKAIGYAAAQGVPLA
ncbi:MAG TPA: hypothetical protein VFJ58_15910 [Armatimonadota bacterium]|nr:hypothetical protein [Armatimonadota bacterium]